MKTIKSMTETTIMDFTYFLNELAKELGNEFIRSGISSDFTEDFPSTSQSQLGSKSTGIPSSRPSLTACDFQQPSQLGKCDGHWIGR